jgi:hypothetical protein
VKYATSLPFLKMTKLLYRLVLLSVAGFLAGCEQVDRDHYVVISIPDQAMDVYTKGHWTARYLVSTSKYGEGDQPGTSTTPLGHLAIAQKIGGAAPLGEVFKSRRPTGEILAPNTPGRDPIVSRILWLRGLERHNQYAYQRYIYIHGTPEERYIGRPASYGCIRMRSADVIVLYNTVGKGARVDIVLRSLPTARPSSSTISVAVSSQNSAPTQSNNASASQTTQVQTTTQSPQNPPVIQSAKNTTTKQTTQMPTANQPAERATMNQ